MSIRICLIITVLLATAAMAADLPSWNFEDGVQGWVTLDKQAQLEQCKDAAHVRQGAASLHFGIKSHPAGQDEMPGLMALPLQGGLVGAKCLHVALQSSVAGPVIFVLQEQDESNYMTFGYLSANDWHDLDLPLADFRLDEKSTDENGKLDPEQIKMFGIADPGVFLEQSGMPFYYVRPAQRDFWLDDVEAQANCPELGTPQQAGTKMIEDCDSDVGYFMVLGGKDLKASICADPAVHDSSLRLDYTLPEKTLLAVARQFAAGTLAGARGISFSIRSANAMPVLVMVEEENRARYEKIVEVPAGQWLSPVITWGDMTLSGDSRDATPGIQPETIRSIAFADVTALIGQKETADTLWLDEITTAP